MKKFLLATAATGLCLVLAAQADAAPQLQLSLDDGNGNSALLIDVGNTGLLIFNGPLGNWTVNVTTGVGYPSVGSLALPVIDLNSVNVNNASGGTLTMKLTQIGNVGVDPLLNFSASIGGTVSSRTGSVLSYSAYSDSTNAAFGTQSLLGSQSFNSGPFSYGNIASGQTGALFSMTEIVTITMAAGTAPGNSSFNGELRVLVPEPASMALLGAGLLGLGFARRRRG